MKTAISVPDATFERVTRRASELGMSRSKLFSRAADDYLDRLDDASLTEQINHSLTSIEVDASTSWTVDLGHRLLSDGADW
jgi:metal-responsive CopG/Arc/MetJ family transcriptional regulator